MLRDESKRLQTLILQLNARVQRNKSFDSQERMEQFALGMEEINAVAARLIDEVLNPSQKALVLRAYFRSRLKNEQLAEIFRDDGMARYLALSPEQKTSVLKLADELDREFAEEIVRIRAGHLRRVLEETLLPEQRTKFESLLPPP